MKWRASIRSPSAVTTPAARLGSPATGCTAICVSSTSVRTSPPASVTAAMRASASRAEPPMHICALPRAANSAGMWWPKPGARGSTSRRPLKNRRPACTAGLSNSRSTNSRGEQALVFSSRRPSVVASKRRRRSRAGSGGACASGSRICVTIGRNASRQRRRLAASRRLN